MRWPMAMLLAAAACSGTVPQPSNREVAPPPGAEDAAQIVLHEWAERLDDYAAVDVGPPPTRWFEDNPLVYPTHSSDGGALAIARATAFSTWNVEMHLIYRERPSDSALAHELLHWSLHVTGRGWGADHTEPIWDEVGPVEGALAAAGL